MRQKPGKSAYPMRKSGEITAGMATENAVSMVNAIPVGNGGKPMPKAVKGAKK
jgi:hypothetical protein